MKRLSKWWYVSLILLVVTLLNMNSPLNAATEVKVQMYNGNTASQINTIFPWYKITNTGSTVVNLADVKIRYYYTVDGEKPQNFWCDWSTIGSSNVTGTFSKLDIPKDGTDYCFELGFQTGAGKLNPGQSIEVHNRFTKTDRSNYDQSNDYSFNPTAKTYVDWDKITVHLNGEALVTSHDYIEEGKWVNQPVNINLTAVGGSGNVTTYYNINNGPTNTGVLIQLSQDGIYNINFWSADSSGNIEAQKSLTIKIDQTVPVVKPNVSPSPNVNRWNNTDVTVSFTGTDNLSGLSSITAVNEIVTEGSGQVVKGQALDKAGNIADVSVTVNLDKTPPVLGYLQPSNGAVVNHKKPIITASLFDGLSGIDTATICLTIDGQVVNAVYDQKENIVSFEPQTELNTGSHTVALNASDLAGNNVTGITSSFMIVVSDPNLPPDPATVAPSLNPTIVSDMKTATSFIYTGENPIQKGMDPETIEAKRAAVIRGKVMDKEGEPLPGVKVTILNHPEYGQTLSRADGVFDLAVNGGKPLVLRYEKTGYFSVQRQITVPWQDFTVTSDVIMIMPDGKATPISFRETERMQVARGSVINDADGSRQATLFFPAGTKIVGSDLEVVNVRATEYTVGENGPKMMPAELPLSIGYTYCVELGVDEAENVEFNQSVYFYVDNFLNFPVGEIVPCGYYDKAKALWLPSDNGKVIQVIGIDNGLAELDVIGDGQKATLELLNSLNITEAELEQIAKLYSVGKTLWRVPIKHFSIWDCNWPFGPPEDAVNPIQDPPRNTQLIDEDCKKNGSIIETRNQILRELIPINGTPFSLSYSSARMPGNYKLAAISINLSDARTIRSLKRIDLEVQVAGKVYNKSFDNGINQKEVFVWDGNDAYERPTKGKQTAKVKIGYVYDGVYKKAQRFGYSGNGSMVTGSRTRQEVTLWQEYLVDIGYPPIDVRNQGLGGWTLSEHHLYDYKGHILYLGNGERVSAEDLNSNVITTYIDSDKQIGQLYGLAFDSKGILYISINSSSSYQSKSLYKVYSDGTFELMNDPISGSIADGIPIGSAYLPGDTQQIAVGPDDSIYLVQSNCVRKISPNGIITTIAGGNGPYISEGQLATSVRFHDISGVAVGNDGSVYISDTHGHKVWKVMPDGIIVTYAGTGVSGFSGDGGPATLAKLDEPRGLAIDKYDNLYIAEYKNSKIRKVTSDGIISTAAGKLGPADGKLETRDNLDRPWAVAVASDGTLYIADTMNLRIRRLTTNGETTTYAGTGEFTNYQLTGNNGPPTKANIGFPYSITVGPNDKVYFYAQNLIRLVSSFYPGFKEDDYYIASRTGGEVYHFDKLGKHLETINTVTGPVLYTFNYDVEGRLISIVDDNNNITSIERSADGTPLAIIGPFGQRTFLEINADGLLQSITNDAREKTSFTYHEGGLLKTFTNPKKGTSIFSYDNFGRLIKDENPAGGYTSLERIETEKGFQVKVTESKDNTSNYITSYSKEIVSGIGSRLLVSGCCGGPIETISGTNGTKTITRPDGTIIETKEGPDPRFGMQSPLIKSMKMTTPSGKVYKMTGERVVTLENKDNPLSLLTQTDTVTINGKTSTTLYDATAKTVTSTSPEGRQTVSTLDDKGRIIKTQVPGLAPIVFEYDAYGRLIKTTSGTGSDARISSFSYNSLGYVESTTDSLNRSTSFTYDAVGRVLTQTMHNGKVVSFEYDPNGNVTSLTPPDKSEHSFEYTPVDLTESYNPPSIGAGTASTKYEYNLAKQPTLTIRPDGLNIGFEYNTSGKLLEILLPDGAAITYGYNAITGMLENIIAPDGGGITYSYDGSLLNKTTWAGLIEGSVEYEYDNDFQVIAQTVNGENAVGYSYDNDGLLISAGALGIMRNAENGMLTETTLGNVTESVTYNTFGETKTYQAKVNGSAVFTTSYQTDALGRITSKTETVNGESHTYTYTYDTIGQLTEVYRDGSLYGHYEYDANGNRVAYSGTNGTASGVYDDQDRMLSYGGNSYQYTANGELQSKTTAEGTTSYTYDVLGNLRQITLNDGTKIEYVIDGTNRRVGKKVNGTLVQGFLYQDQLNPVAEFDSSRNVVSRFVYGTRGNVPDYMIRGGVTYRIISDHLGSVRLVVNAATGDIVQKVEYDEFGRVLSDTNPGFQPFGFAGGIYDLQTGLVRFGARDYDAEIGRWTCKDPIGFDGGDGNLYCYCRNDPMNFVDETGFHAKWPSYIPFFGWGYSLGEGLYHAFGGTDNECMDWDEWQQRMLGSTAITAASAGTLHHFGVQMFAKGGAAWHIGFEAGNKMNIVHLGNHIKYGVHLAFGSVAPKVANWHFYFGKDFPFIRFWRP